MSLFDRKSIEKTGIYLTAVLFLLFCLDFVAFSQTSTGLVAYYPFNGNANDESGNGNNGTIYGAVFVPDRFGTENKALLFDGENDYIEINNSSSLSITQQISISFWAKFETSGPYYYPYHIIEKFGSWGTGQREQDINWGVTTGNGEFNLWSLNFNYDQWYNFVSLYDGSTLRTFVNGQLYSSNNASGPINISTTNVYISRYNFGGDYFFDGTLDDFRIYDRALNECEIMEIYHEGSWDDSHPLVTPEEEVICSGEATNLALSNNISGTTWTWTANPFNSISGAIDDQSGQSSSIIQVLSNSDTVAQSVTYNITPKEYGLCYLPAISSKVWVNPKPEIRLYPADTVICTGESTTIVVRNPNISVHGEWLYDLKVTPDQYISGNTISGSYPIATDLTETLINTDIIKHKVEYLFTPQIISVENGSNCVGQERKITLWVSPGVRYTTELSYQNGFNISCFGQCDGFVNVNPSVFSGQYKFIWHGPEGFESSDKNISKLKAGQYIMLVTDLNNCAAIDTFDLTEPKLLTMSIEKSVSIDGSYNLNCAGDKTGEINVEPINQVNTVGYLWSDGSADQQRTGLFAGEYALIITDENNCNADTTIYLTEPDRIKIGFDITEPYCPETSDGMIRLTVTGGSPGANYTYLWSDNSTDPNNFNIYGGQYKLNVTDQNGCSVKDSVFLPSLHETCYNIPNCISPNGDLINDFWNIGDINLNTRAEIEIFDNWGKLVWKSEKGYPHPWDGRSDGILLPVDSYFYIINLHNGSKPIIGSVTIIK